MAWRHSQATCGILTRPLCDKTVKANETRANEKACHPEMTGSVRAARRLFPEAAPGSYGLVPDGLPKVLGGGVLLPLLLTTMATAVMTAAAPRPMIRTPLLMPRSA